MAKSEKDKTFENLPTFVAEYIELVIKNMRYRKKAREEVREELIDHFEAALKDCANEQEKQKKANRMIEEFGDAKLLGVLMRRAKKRCRPLWRTVTARTLQAIAAMIILLILYIAWFLTGKPVITTDYIAQINKLVRPSAGDSLNAAPLYQKAAETLVDINDVRELLRLDFHDANNQQKGLMRQWLAKNQSPLALVASGSQLPYLWQQYHSYAPEQGLLSIALPHLGDFRLICYALCWRAWLNAEAGNINAAISDIETCYRLGRHTKGEKTLIEQLVGIVIEGKSLGTARHLLDTYKIDSGTLADFQHRLQQLIKPENFRPNLQVEKLFVYDAIQRYLTESRFGPSHIYLEGIMGVFASGTILDIPWEFTGLNVLFPHPGKAESIASANALYKFWDETMSKTPAKLRVEEIDTEAQSQRLIKNNLFLKLLMPALGRVHIIAWRNKVDAEGTLVTIALVRYKQDTGDYPESLDKLVETGYISQLPIDPFSDNPIIYRKTADGCILYSVGSNLTDDGGQVARDKNGKIEWGSEQGDWIFWPAEKN